MPQYEKILFIGLDFAGKTSILKVLTQKYDLLENIKPTIRIERSFLTFFGIELNIWDLGGQANFRNEYLNDIRTFAETNSIFYVIDMQHPERFELALQYFTSILIIIESFGLKPQINIYLHKVDPNLSKDSKMQELIQKATNLFLKNSRGHQISVFTTSIYDIKSIMRAFSKSLQKTVKTLQSFSKVLEILADKLELDGLILFDEHLIIVSEYYNDLACEEVCLDSVYNSLYNIRHQNLEMKDASFAEIFEKNLNSKKEERHYRFLNIKFKDWHLFLLTIGKEIVDMNIINSAFKTISR